MTADELRAVVTRRLALWTERLVDMHATPVALIGVGHDDHRGEIPVISLDEPELSSEILAGFLLHAVDELRRVQPAAQPDPQWSRATLETVLKHLAESHARATVAAGMGNICATCEQFVRGLGGRG